MKNEFGLGAIRSSIDIRDYRGVTDERDFPESFELEMPAVKNQGNVCSCVAHALATTIEYFDKKENGVARKMSTAYIYGNRRGSLWKDKGMRVRDALNNCCGYGDVLYNRLVGNVEVPEAIEKFEAVGDDLMPIGFVNGIRRYFSLNSENAIKTCLMDYGPVVFAVDWYTDNYIRNGVLYITGNKAKHDGSHCMVIYGWNKDGWLIQNSWGIMWGNLGRAVLPYNTKLLEAWGIEDKENDQSNIDIVEPFKTTIGKLIAKIINLILNYFRR